jgi:hypothetical protein
MMRIFYLAIVFFHAITLFAADHRGIISGSVTEGATGKEISGVIVRLFLVNQACPEREILTDQNGEFYFSGVPSGRYRVNATRNGYVRTTYGQTPENPIGQELLITGVSSAHRIHFELSEAAAVSGHIFDADGNALAKSYFSFESVTHENRTFRGFADELGYFHMADLPADFYKISARRYDSSHQQTVGDRWYYPGTLDEAKMEAIELEVGKTAVVDIRFGKAPEPGWIGKVFGPEGEAIPNADLSFLRSENSRWVPLAACRTAEDGTCSVRNLQPGNYWVYVARTPAPYATWLKKDAPEKSMERLAKVLLVEPDKQATTEFQLEKGIRVPAKIYVGSGAPAASETGIQLTLSYSWQIGNMKLPLNAGVVYDSPDSIEFYLHPELSYELEVTQADSRKEFSVSKINWNRAPFVNPIQVEGDNTAQMEIWVAAGSSISGKVSGAKVVFAELQEASQENFYPTTHFSAIVQQGNFLFQGLPAGTYRIHRSNRNGPFVEVTVAAGESKIVSFE